MGVQHLFDYERYGRRRNGALSSFLRRANVPKVNLLEDAKRLRYFMRGGCSVYHTHIYIQLFSRKL